MAGTNLDANLKSALADLQVIQETTFQEMKKLSLLELKQPSDITEKAPPPPAPAATSGGLDQSERDKVSEKLKITEKVMKKLYKRNVDLEKKVEQLTNDLQTAKSACSCGQNASPSTPNAQTPQSQPPPQTPPRTADSTRTESKVDDYQQKHLLYMMQQRDMTIEELTQVLKQMQRRIAVLEGAQQAQKMAIEDEVQRRLDDANRESHLNYQKYLGLRQQYTKLLNTRIERIGKAQGSSKEMKKVMSHLLNRLETEAKERSLEQEMLNDKLYRTEQRNCDWYVEKKLKEQEIATLNEEFKARDKIDAEIEQCLFNLFERLKTLESENQQLREKVAGS